jgi:hypothetical protein
MSSENVDRVRDRGQNAFEMLQVINTPSALGLAEIT